MHPFAGALALAAALLPSSATRAAQDPSSSSGPRIHLRLLDARKRPLPAGTEAYADLTLPPAGAPPFGYVFRDNNFGMLLPRMTVREGGAADFAPLRQTQGALEWYLLVRARSEWGIAHWGSGGSAGSAERPMEIAMRLAEVLCRGRLLDDRGRAVPFEEVDFLLYDPRIEDEHVPQLLLLEGFQRHGSGFEMWGVPQHGDWMLAACHGDPQIEARRCRLEIGRSDLDLVFPASGCVQLELRMPEAFPRGTLEAVYRHAESGEVSRRQVHADASPHRLRIGEHALHLELGGEHVLDLGKVRVLHGQQLDLPIELRLAQ